MHPREVSSLTEKQIGCVGQQIPGVRAPLFPAPPCHPLPAPSEVPSFRYQPAASQREETWAQPTAWATPSRCTFHSSDCGGRTRHEAGLHAALVSPRASNSPLCVGEVLYEEGQTGFLCEDAEAVRSPDCLRERRLPHPHGRRYNGAGHLGTLPAPCLNPPASL